MNNKIASPRPSSAADPGSGIGVGACGIFGRGLGDGCGVAGGGDESGGGNFGGGDSGAGDFGGGESGAGDFGGGEAGVTGSGGAGVGVDDGARTVTLSTLLTAAGGLANARMRVGE